MDLALPVVGDEDAFHAARSQARLACAARAASDDGPRPLMRHGRTIDRVTSAEICRARPSAQPNEPEISGFLLPSAASEAYPATK
jgi:hypothetical protein